MLITKQWKGGGIKLVYASKLFMIIIALFFFCFALFVCPFLLCCRTILIRVIHMFKIKSRCKYILTFLHSIVYSANILLNNDKDFVLCCKMQLSSLYCPSDF